MDFYSPAQVAGYVAFLLGVTAFLQRRDRRLKFFNACQSLAYALHFLLLGNLSASSTALISSVRSFLATRYQSWLLAVAIIAVNLCAAAAFVRSAAGWLPVIGSCTATVALFTMRGIPLRSVLLACTLMWLANNIISRSIGGTLLELVAATVNTSTMIRMVRQDTVMPLPVPANVD
jgi:hypothetical protein